MHQAIPYKTWTQTQMPKPIKNSTDARKLAMETPVIIFGKRGCCMCHVMKRLLLALGVNPAVYEVDESEENELIRQLMSVVSLSIVDLNQKSGNEEGHDKMMMMMLPCVFVGGEYLGGLERIMAKHICGELVPSLKQAGALWL